MEKLRGKVCPVGPRYGMPVRIHRNRSKQILVTERPKNLPVQFAPEIDLPRYAICELHPDHIIADIPRVGDSHHRSTPAARSS